MQTRRGIPGMTDLVSTYIGEAAYCLANPICSGSGSGLPLRQVHPMESLAKRLPTKHFRVPRGVDCV